MRSLFSVSSWTNRFYKMCSDRNLEQGKSTARASIGTVGMPPVHIIEYNHQPHRCTENHREINHAEQAMFPSTYAFIVQRELDHASGYVETNYVESLRHANSLRNSESSDGEEMLSNKGQHRGAPLSLRNVQRPPAIDLASRLHHNDDQSSPRYVDEHEPSIIWHQEDINPHAFGQKKEDFGNACKIDLENESIPSSALLQQYDLDQNLQENFDKHQKELPRILVTIHDPTLDEVLLHSDTGKDLQHVSPVLQGFPTSHQYIDRHLNEVDEHTHPGPLHQGHLAISMGISPSHLPLPSPASMPNKRRCIARQKGMALECAGIDFRGLHPRHETKYKEQAHAKDDKKSNDLAQIPTQLSISRNTCNIANRSLISTRQTPSGEAVIPLSSKTSATRTRASQSGTTDDPDTEESKASELYKDVVKNRRVDGFLSVGALRLITQPRPLRKSPRKRAFTSNHE